MKFFSKNSILFGFLLLFIFSPTFSQTHRPQPCEGLTSDDCKEFLQTGKVEAPVSNVDSDFSGAQSSDKVNACATAFNLITPYNSNNGQRGCMFDITATNNITISCFDVNLYAGTTANYEIWYRPSSHVGFENSSAGWTQLGSVTGITSAGNNLPTAIPITFNVFIPAGQTYSFYITNDFGGGTSYTDGMAVGNFLASDANMTIYEGVGKSYPFGLTFIVRNFNGTIFYDLGGGLDAEKMVLNARKNGDDLLLSWLIPGNKNQGPVDLQRSENGVTFETFSEITSGNAQGSLVDYSVNGATHYFYRLRGFDENGQEQFSNIAQVKSADRLTSLKTFPNPFSSVFKTVVTTSADGMGFLSLNDLQGKLVWESRQLLETGLNQVDIDGSELEPGVYILRVLANGKSRTERVVKM